MFPVNIYRRKSRSSASAMTLPQIKPEIRPSENARGQHDCHSRIQSAWKHGLDDERPSDHFTTTPDQSERVCLISQTPPRSAATVPASQLSSSRVFILESSFDHIKGRKGGRKDGERGCPRVRPFSFPEYKWCLGDLVVTRSPTNESLVNVTSESEGLEKVVVSSWMIFLSPV